MAEAKTAAHNVAASLRVGEKQSFVFDAIGSLAVLGHRTAVAEIKGRRFSGFPAWWMWRTIYWSKLPRLDRRIRVATDWTLDLFFPADIVQLGMGRPHPDAETAGRGDAETDSESPRLRVPASPRQGWWP